MKSILSLLIVVAVFIAANLISGSGKAPLVDHSKKPVGNYALRKRFEKTFREYKPQIVLMGNSMLTESVDPKAFTYHVKKRALRFSRGGSATAWWYLGLKNIIAESPTKPNVVTVFFRDDFLTKPGYRVTDTYKLSVNDFCNEHEPLLDRLAYLNGMDQPTYLLNKYCPLYRQKDNIRNDIDSFIKNTCVANLLGSGTAKIDKATANVFNRKNMNPELMTARQEAAESSTSKEKANFESLLSKSFLPHMIDIAETNGIHLVFVRVKRRRDITPNAQPEFIKSYMKHLRTYLTSKDIELIDFTDDRNLKLEHYAEGDHLNRTKGMPLFTKMVANELMPIIQKHCE
ncbi:MAG: hypothetical protein K9M75_04560 [Phycisphaerae bacterium]|nr:hypothetical protein [Phycisphaerae bacterium]